MMDNDFGPISNIKIENNHLAGGSFTIYADGKFSSSDSISGVVISGNHIDPGQYGYMLTRDASPSWTNNIDASSNRYVDSGGSLLGAAPPYFRPIRRRPIRYRLIRYRLIRRRPPPAATARPLATTTSPGRRAQTP